MRSNRGSVFVVTLAVLAGLVALVAGIAASHREGVHAEIRRLEDRRAEVMAEAAVQHAVALIQQIKIGTPAQKSDAWATAGNSGKVSYTLDTDSYRFEIQDAGARLNLNTVAEDQLKKMQLTSDQVASLMDWRESKKTARQGGAKDEYYNGLSNPYNAKLGNFDSVEELLLVKGLTPSMLIDLGTSAGGSAHNDTSGLSESMLTVDSVSADLDPNGKTKVNLTQATGDQLVAIGINQSVANAIVQAHPNSLSDALRLPAAASAARQLASSTTLNTNAEQFGLINVNTAPVTVLATLPGVSQDIAGAIASHQSIGFRGLGELMDVPGIDAATLANFIDRICVSSKAFVVRCMGLSGKSSCSFEAVLRIDGGNAVHVDRIQLAPLGDMSRVWRWDAQATTKVEMGGVQ